jgi:hypothetical protein
MTVCEFVPHGPYWTACAVTTARPKRPSPVASGARVPFGRDQFEGVEAARCGTRLPANKLTTARLLANVRQAMTMTDGARRVAAGFAATYA